MSGLPARVGAGLGCGFLAVVLLVQGAVLAVLGGGGGAGCDAASLEAGAGAPELTGEQTVNAAMILDVADERRMPQRAAVIAIATALQESGLRNLAHGDRDSLGLFQQRPSQGWGSAPDGPGDQRTAAQRVRDPRYAATAFYTALDAVPGWQQLPLTVAAQAVQRSAYPGAYARWGPLAVRAVGALTAQTCLDAIDFVSAEAGPAAATAISYARAQLGLPYVWGGDGPGSGEAGFDCSGLTHAAYQAAGINLPRTAQTQYDAGPRLPAGAAPQPGDLVFFGTGPDHVTHVGLIVTDLTFMINAPRRGTRIRLERVRTTNVVGYTRPSTVG